MFDKIKDFFQEKKDRRRRKKETERVNEGAMKLAVVFETLNKFRGAGLLYVDFKHKIVTIDQWLAMQYIYDSNDWNNFLIQLQMWARYMFSVNEYQKLFNKTRADAEAKAYKDNPAITQEERYAARMKAVAQLDEDTARQQIAVPDMQFVVLGAADGKPIIVARCINGNFVTESVGE